MAAPPPLDPNAAAKLALLQYALQPEPAEKPKKKKTSKGQIAMFIVIGVLVLLVIILLVGAPPTPGGTPEAPGAPGQPPVDEDTGQKLKKVNSASNIAFKQPPSEAGSAEWSIRACDALAFHNGCFNLDTMVDLTNNTLPLKQGEKVFFGAISVPEGMRVWMKEASGGWPSNCDAFPKTLEEIANLPNLPKYRYATVTGPAVNETVTDQAGAIWEKGHGNYCCFRVELLPGYYCAAT